MSDTKRRHGRAPRRRSVPALALALLVVLLPSLFGAGAAQADVAPFGRVLAVQGLADPDVYKVNDNLYFLSGTSSEDFLPIYTSTDLQTFTLLRRYDPDAVDPDHHYCREWAPELNKQGSDYVLYFVASRVAKGRSCPSRDSQQTIFYAAAPATNNDMQFGPPHAINAATTHPRTYETKDCPTDGCEDAMRLDPSVYSDGSRLWMHYTWFDPSAGAVVSAFPLDAPEEVFEVTRPSRQAEEKVNEAPTLFSRGGLQYLFYSQGNMKSNYGMQYFMGAQVSDLTSKSAKHSFSSPLRAHDDRLIENQGHNTVTDRNGQLYTLYHVARFTADGVYAGRDVYVQPLMFKADGSLNTLNTVDLRWSKTKGSTYSLDVQTRDGVWIAGCMSPGSASSVTFNEVCTGADDEVVHKGDVAAFRINRMADGEMAGTTTLAYDGYTDILDVTV
jgi:GH43 family beta-xylosidase